MKRSTSHVDGLFSDEPQLDDAQISLALQIVKRRGRQQRITMIGPAALLIAVVLTVVAAPPNYGELSIVGEADAASSEKKPWVFGANGVWSFAEPIAKATTPRQTGAEMISLPQEPPAPYFSLEAPSSAQTESHPASASSPPALRPGQTRYLWDTPLTANNSVADTASNGDVANKQEVLGTQQKQLEATDEGTQPGSAQLDNAHLEGELPGEQRSEASIYEWHELGLSLRLPKSKSPQSETPKAEVPQPQSSTNQAPQNKESLAEPPASVIGTIDPVTGAAVYTTPTGSEAGEGLPTHSPSETPLYRETAGESQVETAQQVSPSSFVVSGNSTLNLPSSQPATVTIVGVLVHSGHVSVTVEVTDVDSQFINWCDTRIEWGDGSVSGPNGIGAGQGCADTCEQFLPAPTLKSSNQIVFESSFDRAVDLAPRIVVSTTSVCGENEETTFEMRPFSVVPYE